MRNRTETQITLVLLRHGETKANRERRYLGWTEEALSKEGREKLLRKAKSGGYPEVERLFVSPMQRCLETAAVVYPDRKTEVISEWKEMNFGAFEGKNYQELKEDVRYQAWIDSNGTLPFPEGESREAFIARCERGFIKMLTLLWGEDVSKQKVKLPKTVGAVVHGGTVMALLSLHFGGDYFDYQIPNGSGYVCTIALKDIGQNLPEEKEGRKEKEQTDKNAVRWLDYRKI